MVQQSSEGVGLLEVVAGAVEEVISLYMTCRNAIKSSRFSYILT